MKKDQQLATMLYAGIGSRNASRAWCNRLEELSLGLAKKNWTLRSGAAAGCDNACENGSDRARGSKEIFVPWDGFSNRYAPNVIPPSNLDESLVYAEQYYDLDWKGLTKGQKALYARNVNIILGENFKTPVKFVLCYSEGGVYKPGSGTGHATRVAEAHGISVLNIGEPFMRSPYAVEEELVRLTRQHDKALSSILDRETISAQDHARIAAVTMADASQTRKFARV